MKIHNDLDNRPGIRRINNDDAPISSATPTGQQTLESHVIVPAFIALIVAIVVTLMVAGVMIRLFTMDYFILMFVFGGSFLLAFLKRIGVGDQLLWLVEKYLNADIDGDGEVGVAPRSVPVNTKKGTRDVALSNEESTLYRRDWSQVAIAILNKRANVSWRGIYDNCKLSQSQSKAAAAHLKKGYVNADGVTINGRGWDYLISFLPQNTFCMVERPDPPTDTAPTPSEGGWGGLQGTPPTHPPTHPAGMQG